MICKGVTVDVVARKLGDGGYLLQVDGESHVMHTEEEALGTRLVMDTLSCLIEKEADPSKLIAMSPGARADGRLALAFLAPGVLAVVGRVGRLRPSPKLTNNPQPNFEHLR